MIAKLITVGATRASAIARMRRALDEYFITGIKTTVPFHNAIMRNADFRNGNYDTGFVERVMNSDNFELKPTRRGCTNSWLALDRRRSKSLPALRHSRPGLRRRSEIAGVAEQMIDGGVDLDSVARQKARTAEEIATTAAALHRNYRTARAFHSSSTITLRSRETCGAEGVHLGQDDLPIAEAREIAGPDCVVGKSTHSVDQAIRAFTKARITSASDRSSPHRPNPTIRRSASRTSDRFTTRCAYRSFALAESSWTICRK